VDLVHCSVLGRRFLLRRLVLLLVHGFQNEVEEVRFDAVVYDDFGFAAVDYGALGIELMEVPRYA